MGVSGDRRSGKIGLLCLILALGPSGAQPAEPLHFYRMPAHGCDFLFSSAYEPRVRPERDKFLAAVKRLTTTLEDLALPERCQIVYTVNRFEMATYLEEELKLPADQAQRAVEMGSFRRGKISVVRAGEAGLDWSARYFLTEYARRILLEALPPEARDGAAWFVEGLAVGLAWSAHDPEKLGAVSEYYGSYFDARRPLKLSQMFRRSDYDTLVGDHGAHVQAQAVLSVFYFHLRSRDFSRGLKTLRLYAHDRIFSTAFERTAGIPLENFEKELYESFYPRYRRP